MTTSRPHPSTPTIVGREEWAEEHRRHLDREKELTRRRDALVAERQALPWLEITEPYVFDTPDGAASLVELFDGRGQILVYHFMMGPGWVEGCPSCSCWADGFDGTQPHLAARDTALVAVSRAPRAEIEAYRERMGWRFRWVSSSPSRFNVDLGVSFDGPDSDTGRRGYNFDTQDFGGDEAPGFSAFTRDADDRVFLTHQTFSRGLDPLNVAYQMLDLTAAGRDEGDLDWSMQWLRRHDDYEG